MILKGCLYHLVVVNDMQAIVPKFDSMSVANEIFEVFSKGLPNIPHDQLIDFGINIIHDT